MSSTVTKYIKAFKNKNMHKKILPVCFNSGYSILEWNKVVNKVIVNGFSDFNIHYLLSTSPYEQLCENKGSMNSKQHFLIQYYIGCVNIPYI